jgi:uncharacterized membrane protein
LWAKLRRIFWHRWLDERDARRAVPPDMLARLMRRVSASEARHSGEIRICVEAGLPLSYLWRDASARERAVRLFGKLGVWDTEHNNGVLIYLLLAERAIEIVADRGIHIKTGDAAWAAVMADMTQAFKEDRYEDGLTEALAQVSALLVAHYPLELGADSPARVNGQSDAPVCL